MKINTDLNVEGNIVAPAFFESSLRAIKTNIADFNGDAVALVNELNIVTYDRKDNTAKNKIGIIIDDSPKEFANNDQTAVDLYKTIFVLSKAIQELSSKVDDLNNKILNK